MRGVGMAVHVIFRCCGARFVPAAGKSYKGWGVTWYANHK